MLSCKFKIRVIKIKQDTNYSGDISTLFQGHCQTKLYLQVCSDLYREEKEIDVVNYTGKGKYEALYLETNVLRKDNQFFQCLETTVQFWFFGLCM